MTEEEGISKALELFGFVTGDRQESRLMNLLSVILRLQADPPIPLTFAEIYDQLLKEEPETNLTKAWVHRVLKSLVNSQLIRLESPTAHRKRYIVDVNTVMAGLEQLKSQRIRELEEQKSEIDKTLADITKLECGTLAQQYVKNVTGNKQKISSRIVRGVDELHRVLKYNMLDVARKGDTIRATLLWVGPFLDQGTMDRTQRFVEAAMRGVEIRYMMSVDIFRLEDLTRLEFDEERAAGMIQGLIELKKRGVKFDFRIYSGPKTYFQVSLNKDNMALVISEDPLTATWITRDFNPDLIDNAVKSFDRDWKKAKSLLDMKPEDMAAFGADPGGLIRKIFTRDSVERSD
jgi:Fe2+ or Zn2+ uptake regulation protein